MGQLHLDSSMRALRYLASETIFNAYPLAKIITGFMNVFFLVVLLYSSEK